MTEVLGIDWHRRGRVGVALSETVCVLVEREIAGLIARVPGAAAVGVDMPIGLTDGVREADRLARAFVGPRWPSVFLAPPRAALAAGDYARANAVLVPGQRMSRQAWALVPNIRAVARVAGERVIEVHPEASFRALAGRQMRYAKTTWNGQMDRRQALAAAGIVLPDRLKEAGAVLPADILDAAAVAWTARRYAAGEARSFPPGARPGERAIIWC